MAQMKRSDTMNRKLRNNDSSFEKIGKQSSVMKVIGNPFQEETADLLTMITSPYNKHPLTPHSYIVKLGFTGVFIFPYFCSKT